LARSPDPNMLVPELASAIWKAVGEAFPVRGKVIRGAAGPEIDIGSSVGVVEGMRFLVCTQPNSRYLLPDKLVTVEGPVDDVSAKVEVEGFAPEEIPDEGWYIVEEKAQT
jgi:hypothetical protein